MLNNIPSNVVICLDSSKSPNIFNLANEFSCVTFTCDTDWKNSPKKIVEETGECMTDCSLTNYIYEYQGKCYSKCNESRSDYINNNYKCYGCDPNCKTCSFEANIFINSNCTSCYEDRYLSNGECLKKIIQETTEIIKSTEKLEETAHIIESTGSLGKKTQIIKNTENLEEKIEITDKTEEKIEITEKLEEKKEIIEKPEENDIIPLVKCPKEYPFEILETHICVNNCTIFGIYNGLCIINYDSKDNEENKEIEEKAIENIRKEMKYFNLSYIDKVEDIRIQQRESIITITSTENQKNKKSYINKTNIDLCDCENIIKKQYNILVNKSLYILKIEVKQEGYKIPKIEYEVYYPLFEGLNIKVNLTKCANHKINLSIPISSIPDNIHINNQSSGYYNDICYTHTSKDGTDISLSDRKQEFINNNLTLCEEDCDFIDYDKISGKAICSCKFKTNSTFKIRGLEIDVEKLYDKFTDFNNIANVKVLKCYKLIFKLEAYKNNYANLSLIAVILLYFVCLINIMCKDFPYLKNILSMIVYVKTNSKLVQKIINKKIKEEENKNKTKKSRNILTSNNITNINNNIKKKSIIKKNNNKKPKKNESKKIKQKIKSNPVRKGKNKI